MKTIKTLLVMLALAVAALPGIAGFDEVFTGTCLRIDYYHTGTATEEHFSLDRARTEGAWPGSRTLLLDDTNSGKYLVEVVDLASNRVLYSRGFASIYGEWETTGEARSGIFKTIPEAIRVPEPKEPFQLRLRKRSAGRGFSEVWSVIIDPRSRFIDRAPVPDRKVMTLFENGDPSSKVDLLVLGDGYTAGEAGKFQEDAARLVGALFIHEPFRSRKSDFNVRAIFTPSELSGVSRQRAGLFRNTPLGTRYNSFDSERYILTLDDRAWRDIAAAAPYDFVTILVNDRKYGGGGIFGLYTTTAVGSAFSEYVYVHELGHHLAGLADEYYTSDVAYEESTGRHEEPWEANITALHDPAGLKWADLLQPEIPLPTPWNKETYEKHSFELQERRRNLRAQEAPEEAMEALFRDERDTFTEMLGSEEHAGRVGAFEGAGYQAQGLYRPAVDCIMFTRDEVGFCPVCSRTIEKIIDLYSR